MSLEINRIDLPFAARSQISSCRAFLVFDVDPTVGSSMIRISALAASHLAMLTFCWFPPDSVPTGSTGNAL